MEFVSTVTAFATGHWAEVAVAVFAGLRFAEAIVKLTPSTEDDKIFTIVDGVAGKILGRR